MWYSVTSQTSSSLMGNGTEIARSGRVRNFWHGCIMSQMLRMMSLSMIVGGERQDSNMEDTILLNMIHPLVKLTRNSLIVDGRSVGEWDGPSDIIETSSQRTTAHLRS